MDTDIQSRVRSNKMNKELDDKLCRDFPLLFKDRHGSPSRTAMCWGFPGDGWYELIREAAQKLEPLLEKYKKESEEDSVPCASQVKEKFGSLRFYMSHYTSDMYKIITKAEQKSCITCEFCGEKGKLRRGSWLKTLCDKCSGKDKIGYVD